MVPINRLRLSLNLKKNDCVKKKVCACPQQFDGLIQTNKMPDKTSVPFDSISLHLIMGFGRRGRAFNNLSRSQDNLFVAQVSTLNGIDARP